MKVSGLTLIAVLTSRLSKSSSIAFQNLNNVRHTAFKGSVVFTSSLYSSSSSSSSTSSTDSNPIITSATKASDLDISYETILKGPELPPLDSMSKRLFLIRHGEVINPGGDRPVYYGAMDVSLSPLGELEAKVRGERLR